MNELPDKPSISLIIACMYAGKSTELIRRATICHELGLKVIYINSALDTRSSFNFSTHNQTITQVPFTTIKTLKLQDVDVTSFDVVAVDEGQVFKGLVDFCVELCEKLGKIVIVAGLDGDYKRQPFGEICNLIPLCDNITKLKAFCVNCKKNGKIKPAIFTKRETNETDTILIGGKNIYVPVCRECWNH